LGLGVNAASTTKPEAIFKNVVNASLANELLIFRVFTSSKLNFSNSDLVIFIGEWLLKIGSNR
jgi:hypothetical protein